MVLKYNMHHNIIYGAHIRLDECIWFVPGAGYIYLGEECSVIDVFACSKFLLTLVINTKLL